jgi:hypothetical protein
MLLSSLIESTNLITAEFLKKWLQTGEKKLSQKKLKWNMHVLKRLRFQLIEGRAMAQSDQNHFEDLKFTTKISVSKWHNSDKQILLTKKFKIVARVLSNQDEVKLSDQVAEKLLELFKEKANNYKRSDLRRIYCCVLRRIN